MVIHRSGTFDYLVMLPAVPWKRPGPWIAVDPPLQKLVAQDDPREDDRLVGPRPILEMNGGVLKLVAPTTQRASVRSFQFEVDPELIAVLRPSDTMYLRRTQLAGIGLTVLRGRRLIVAVGAVTGMPLGSVEVIRLGWAVATCVGQDKAILEDGQRVQLGDYVIRSEHGCCPFPFPGVDEMVSITLAGTVDQAVAERSTRLMGERDPLMVRFTPSEESRDSGTVDSLYRQLLARASRVRSRRAGRADQRSDGGRGGGCG